MKTLAVEYPIGQLCDVLDVSKSGYYKWCGKSPGPRAQANAALLACIKTVHQESRLNYGSPRVTRQLQLNGIRCGKNRVANLMRQHGIRARRKRPFRPRTTNSRHRQPIAPNQLKDLKVSTANRVWVADITYIWTVAGWAYLAAVMDLYSRKIVGWSISHSLESSLVIEALQQALRRRQPPPGLLHHSDRGIQYTSTTFQSLLHRSQIIPSMSAKGHCYDNAAMESFWSTLKTELISHSRFENLQQASIAIFDYLETFYNPKRLHSSLDYKSPVDFEKTLNYNHN